MTVNSVDARNLSVPLPHVEFLVDRSTVRVSTDCGELRLNYVTDTDGDSMAIWSAPDTDVHVAACMELEFPGLLAALQATRTWHVLASDEIALDGDVRVVLRRRE